MVNYSFNAKKYRPSLGSQISHDLRISLTGIMGMLHFINQTSLTPQQKEYLDIIQTSADHLLTLENKLCSLVKNKH